MTIDPIAAFEEEKRAAISSYPSNQDWQKTSAAWMDEAFVQKYMYNFTSLGRPIIQLPTDMVAFQEIVWSTRPDLIIETGIAHGGSIIMSAMMLALLDYCDAAVSGEKLDPRKSKRRVLAVDIDIRSHNRAAIESHPLAGMIDMIQGSSISQETIDKVKKVAAPYKRVLVSLDSNHTHDHVMAELEAYAPLTTKDSYCLVFDTVVEDLRADMFPNRPWHPGNSPKTAVFEYLKKLEAEKVLANDGDRLQLAVDRGLEDKLMLTVAPHGYLKRV